MKIKNLILSIITTIVVTLLANNVAQAQRFVDVIGNPPYGSDPVSGVIGSGSTPNRSNRAIFSNGVQSKINAVSTTLTVANTSGNQFVNGNRIEVEANAAETVLAVINAPLNSSPPARDALIAALGGGSAALQLAQSMQGMRRGDGSIDPIILTGAANSYNSYTRSLFDSTQATQKPIIELDSYIQGLPPGQKAIQVILGKLLEAAR